VNSTSIKTFEVYDMEPPKYSNIITNPTNPVYSPSATYEFKITWTDNIAVDKVILQFNGVNYTDATKAGDVYSRTFSDLSAGTYTYKWYANDTRNNWNNTNTQAFTISQAAPTLSLTSSKSIDYGTAAGMTGSTSDSGNEDCTYTLYRSGSSYGSGTSVADNTVLAAGSYPYVYNTSGCTNYTSGETSSNLIVNKITPLFSTSVTTPITYGTASNYAASESNTGDSDCSYILLRNGIQIASGSSVSDNSILGVGVWNYTYYTIGCSNYTSNKDEKLLTVNKMSRTCTLATDKAWARTYDGTASSTTCSVSAGSSDGSMTFTKNSIPVSTPDSQTNAGTFNYACQWNGGNNYSDCTLQTNSLVISKATPTCALTSLNGWNYGYGTSTTLSCLCNGDGTTHLYLNNALHDEYNNNNMIFSANLSGYSVVCNITQGTNYNSAITSNTLVINKAIPSGLLTSDKGWNIISGTTVTIGYTESNEIDSDVTYKVWRDSADKGSGETWTPGVGTYYYKLNTTGGTNFTSVASMDIKTLTVSPISLPIVTIISPASPYHKISVPLNVTIDRPSMISYSLDGKTNVTNTSYVTSYFKPLTGLTNGNHNLIVYATDSSGNIGFNTTSFSYCLGDMDHNKAVGLTDLVILAQTYGKSCGQPGYDDRADLNGDCSANLADLVILAQNYGKNCTA
jgi:hypothetical protein